MDDLRIQIAHMGIAGDSQGEVHDTTWGEFVASNPDFDPVELRHILKQIRSGRPYREQTDEGLFEIRPLYEQDMSDEEAKAFVGFKKIPWKRAPTENPVYVNPRGDSFMIRAGYPFRARYKNLDGNMIWVTNRLSLARLINTTTKKISDQGLSRNSDLIRQIMKSKPMGNDIMKKSIDENSSAGAVCAGNVSGGSPGMLFSNPVKRTTEETGDIGVDDDTSIPDEGDLVEFVRNGVPYRGIVESIHGRYLTVNIGGRHVVVETALVNLNGAPEPESRGTVEYGKKTAKQDHAQSSPTTPNKTMQKFVGASEAIGDDSNHDHEMIQSRLKSRIRKGAKYTDDYTCDICDEHFPTIDDLHYHEWNFHNKALHPKRPRIGASEAVGDEPPPVPPKKNIPFDTARPEQRDPDLWEIMNAVSSGKISPEDGARFAQALMNGRSGRKV